MGDDGLQADDGRPLADRLRPQTLADFAGQAHLVGEGAPLARLERLQALDKRAEPAR